MQSKATTVEQYLAELPEERRAELQRVRDVILANLGEGYREGMLYGMVGYFVPHELYPAGYHCDPSQPLSFVCLASQKQHLSLYLTCLYANHEQLLAFRAAWAKTGKKLDMGKSCIRFKRADDLALELIAAAIRRTPVAKLIKDYEAVLKAAQRTKEAGKAKSKPVSKLVRKKASGVKAVAKAGKRPAKAPSRTGKKKSPNKP